MKPEKLFEIIGEADDAYVRDAKNKVVKKKHHRWLYPGVAAMLVCAIVIGILGGRKEPFALEAYALSEAQYPVMVKYPEDNTDYDAYSLWRESRNRQMKGYWEADIDINEFLSSSIAEFLSNADGENRVYSPLNVYMALAMTAELTDGNSRAQILSLLGYESMEQLRKEASLIWNAHYCDDGLVTSILASSLWLRNGLEIREDTVKTLAETYYASVYQGEMGSENFNEALQAWINRQTGGMLSDQLKDIEMTPETLMAWATTIYFRAEWESTFSEEKNEKSVFHGADDDVMCEFMNGSDISGYYWGEHFSAAEKSLQKGGAMYFILPDEGVSVEELLTDSQVIEMLQVGYSYENQKTTTVNFSIPKFDVSSQIDLIDGLQNLGVVDIFDISKADFSSSLPDRNAAVTSVTHGARVAIDEEGCIAAAYTLIMTTGGTPPLEEVDFVLDRPFLFVVTSEVGLPLFVGIVNQLS